MIVGLVAVLVASVPSPAWAHITIATSDPPAATSLDALPSVVSLTFTGDLDPLAEVVVTGPDGSDLSSGDPAVEGATLTQPVEAPEGADAPGQYAVAFRVTSTDGHVLTGRVAFAVGVPYDGTSAPAADGSTADAAATSAPPSTARSPGGWLTRDVAVPTMLLLLSLGAWLLSRREGRERRPVGSG